MYGLSVKYEKSNVLVSFEIQMRCSDEEGVLKDRDCNHVKRWINESGVWSFVVTEYWESIWVVD